MTKRTTILIAFILLKFLLQYLLISPHYELQRDEYLHLDQANHLAWGYTSVPPVTSWISSIIKLLGNSVFWIRFFPAVFGALTILVVWKTITFLKGNLFACILGATGVLFSVLLRLNILYQPNALDVLCWATFYYVVILYIGTEKKKWLFVAALVFAIGFLNKYNIVFLLLGFLPAILLSPHRGIFKQRSFYLALLMGLILILPNLIWQYQNNFPVIHHMKELSETQLVNVKIGNFLLAQLFFFIGAAFIIIAGWYALLRYPAFAGYRLFFWSFLITLFIFIYFKAKDYYVIGLYPIYISFGAVYLEQFLQTGWRRYLRPITIVIPILLFIPMYRYFFPNKSPDEILRNQKRYRELGLLRWEDGKDHELPQDFADMLGWKELTRKVDSVYSMIPDREHTIVLCDNYGQAGAINYYTRKGIKAVSFNADYINWIDLSHPYVNLIRVKTSGDSHDELQKTAPIFNAGFIAGSITNRFSREYGTTIFVFRNAKTDINKRIAQEIKEEKAR